jgi:hypothetical protein
LIYFTGKGFTIFVVFDALPANLWERRTPRRDQDNAKEVSNFCYYEIVNEGE